MPFYRVNGMMVHLNLGHSRNKKAPAQCRAPLELDGKVVPCCGISSFLCDHDMGHGQTCDMPLCAEHAHEVGKDRHLCPNHMAARPDPELF